MMSTRNGFSPIGGNRCGVAGVAGVTGVAAAAFVEATFARISFDLGVDDATPCGGTLTLAAQTMALSMILR